jgi:hypothetical protein
LVLADGTAHVPNTEARAIRLYSTDYYSIVVYNLS